MMQNNQPIIGVTGITGSATSTVSTILAEHGGYVIVADKLAHEVMQKGQAAYEKVVAEFGNEILKNDGEIDRKVLGGLVFANKKRLASLEAIIHPIVTAKIQELLAIASHCSFAVIDAPLLIESGLHTMCYEVWLVTASNELRLARIMARDNIDTDTATRRINNRLGDDALRPFADIIIKNDGNLINLKETVQNTIMDNDIILGRIQQFI